MNSLYKKMRITAAFGLCFLLLHSCALVGVNMHHKTPRKAGKYPSFNRHDSLVGALTPLRAWFDVTYYGLNIEVFPNKKSIAGYSDIGFNAVMPGQTMQIDLFKNMQVDSIMYQSQRLDYYREKNAVFITFPDSLYPQNKYNIRFFYHGKPLKAKKPPWEGGFVWEKDKDKNPWIGVACEVTGSGLWRPVKDHLTDEADSVKVTVTVPDNLYCVSNGILTGEKTNNGKATYTWLTQYPMNTYNTTIYIGNYASFNMPYQSAYTDFDMDFYVLPYNKAKAQSHFQQTIDIVRVFEELFGPYPWPDEGFKMVESPYAGMEHQTAIAYGNGYKNQKYLGADHIILHETAHEWWGNSVTATDFAEAWIHEGFATYSEALYLEKTQGKAQYQSLINLYALLIKNKRPVIGPYHVNYWDYKDTDLYLKGALTLHSLRTVIANASVFFDILKTFYNNHAYGLATTNDFIDLVNQKTGKNHRAFFGQYLYQRACPEMEVKSGQINDSVAVIEYRFTNTINHFTLPIKIKSGQDKSITIYPTTEWQKVYVKNPEKLRVETETVYMRLKKLKY